MTAAAILSENCLHLHYAQPISLADSHWGKHVLSFSIKHKIFICFYTFCENLSLFQQELPRLLACEMMSIFLGHPEFIHISIPLPPPPLLFIH